MMRAVFILQSIILVCYFTKVLRGELDPASGPCSNDTAFRCTDYRNFQNWNIMPPSGVGVSINIRNTSNPPGTEIERQAGGSLVVFNVISSNSSFMSVTLKIFNSSSINETIITCNGNTQSLIVPKPNDPPMAINISLQNGTRLIINWYPNKGCYCYSLCSEISNCLMEGNTIVTENVTGTELTIFGCGAGSSNFDIGNPCLQNDINNKISGRTYELNTYKHWSIVDECNSNQTVTATCDGGDWNRTICPETTQERNDETTSFSYHTTATAGGDNMIYSSIIYGSVTVSTQQTKGENSVLIPVVVSVIVVIIIVFLFVVVIVIIVSRLKRGKKSSRDSHSEVELSEEPYQQLQHSNGKKNNSRIPRGLNRNVNDMGHLDQGQYSDFGQKKIPNLPSTEPYESLTTPPPSKSVRTNNSQQYSVLENNEDSTAEVQSNGYCVTSHASTSKAKKLEYTDVDTLHAGGAETVIDIKVDYTNIDLNVYPQDFTLDLDSLLIQLNSISKDFQLFGSVAGISPEILDEITDSCAESYEGLVEVCDAWLDKCRREKTTPTWRAVAEILSLIGRDKMAEDIMQVYVTGKLPIVVDMNSVNIQGAVRLPTPPPPVPPHRYEDTSSEVELMTVTSVMTNRDLKDAVMEDEPPPIPERPPDLVPDEDIEESQQALPELPPKLPAKAQTKPAPAKRHRNKDDENTPSLPPRPPKNK